jgi:hypothetical protein
MLLTPLTRTAARLARRRARRIAGGDAVAAASRLSLVTLALAAAVALCLHRLR